jgi:uncharacterized protein (TIGR03435 family)
MRSASLVLPAILCAAQAFAQNPAATSLRATFEVASVKRNISGDLRQSWDREPGGRVVYINFTLRDLVRDAYGLRDQQLIGGPDWFDREHFDVIARGPAGAAAQADAMMRGLLADRFALQVHWERRELDVYELVVARPDGRLGPKLRPRPDCRDGEVREPANDGREPCGGMLVGPGRLTVRGQGIPAFARDRIVLDKTGLKGNFDIDLEYAPMPGEFPTGGPPPPANAPALPAALQEQLGLRLVPARATVDVLVVDRAQLPTEN